MTVIAHHKIVILFEGVGRYFLAVNEKFTILDFCILIVIEEYDGLSVKG